jgi:hypothetical protein
MNEKKIRKEWDLECPSVPKYMGYKASLGQSYYWS